MSEIFLAMSGGVDSSTAAHLLQQAGYAVRGVTMQMFPGGDAPVRGAAEVCRVLGIPHTAIDVSDAFAAAVMEDFRREYAAGRTPNPCVVCNREIKFPLLLRCADEIAPGARIATGHYARIVRCGDRLAIAKAADPAKDQSYMLWQLSQQTLARLVFPLGDYRKEEIRAIAAQAGLPGASAGDSQDICFIPNGDYTAFLVRCGVPLPAGEFTDESGKILGQAKNQACYTVGQKRGLGIALGRPMYVKSRDAAANRVVITPDDPHGRVVTADNVRYMAAAPGELDTPRRLSVKFRYARNEYPCTVRAEGDRLLIEPDEPVRAPAPGQSAVLYDGDVIVAGGLIAEWE